jgi:hypothetical protein
MKRLRWISCLLLVALPMLAVAGCGRWMAERAAARRGLSWPGATEDYREEVARAKQAGLPLDMREMQVPLPPAARNAAPSMRR